MLLINYFSCKTVETHHDTGGDTDQNTIANIDNWLQQVTEKNGAREDGKKNAEQDMDITPGYDVQTEPICSRK